MLKSQTLTFCVIGAGPAGQAMAAHLAMRGFPVNLHDREERALAGMGECCAITVHGVLGGTARLNRVTAQLPEALEGADVVVVAVPAHEHAQVAASCRAWLRDGQTVLVAPGRLLGAFEFASVVQTNVAAPPNLLIGETQTIPFTSRLRDDGTLNVLAVKSEVPLAAYPADATQEILDRLTPAFPMFRSAGDTLETGFSSVSPVLHPLPMLVNLGRVQSGKAYRHYVDGITPVVARLLERIDAERLAIAEAFGVLAMDTRQWLCYTYGAVGGSLYEALQNTECYAHIQAPATIGHRYLLEDVPTGLVPLESLGTAAGVATPAIRTAIDLADMVCETDFRQKGRTLQSLGLSGCAAADVRRLLRGPVKPLGMEMSGNRWT